LSLLSISIGFLTRDLFIGFGTDFWGMSIFILPQNYVLSDIEFIDLFHKLLPLIISIFGASSAYFIYSFGLEYFYTIKKTSWFKAIYNFLNRKWYFDRLYNEFIGQNSLNLSYHFSYKHLDRGIIEKLGPSGIVSSINYTIEQLINLQSGHIYHYLFLFLFSTFFLIFIVLNISHFYLSINILIFLAAFLFMI